MIAMIFYDHEYVNPANFTGYWMSTFSNATIFLIFSCPAAAASAAIMSSRARRARLWEAPAARPPLVIVWQLIWPSVVASCVAQGFGLALLTPATWGTGGRIPFEVLFAWLAIILLHASVGFLIGRVFVVAASIPLAIFVSYSWLGFTWAVDYLPVRYLSGLVLAACCSVDTTMDVNAIASVTTFSLIVSLALLIAAVPFARRSRSLARNGMKFLSFILILVATVTGLGLARDLGPQPTAPRAESELVCSGSGPRVCLFPEQTENTDPRPVLAQAYANLVARDVPVPSVISGASGEPGLSTLHVAISTMSTPASIIRSLAASLIPNDVAPYCDNGTDYRARVDVAAVASWWLGSVAADGQIPLSAVVPVVGTENSSAQIQRFQSLPPSRQREWYMEAKPSLEDCDAPPIEVPFE